ncbi:branched-chain amino acid ABC transporter permease [uncultured Enterovirga sp.]|uniref:branched-chain amino acid ABC transporter permease n=1 Tax=uncultured Enterovirga sp. TaxID=2026352 RepID=UPI0035CA637D
MAAIAAAGAVGFFLFPYDLGLLSRICAMALLVLSLDLVVGYCGVATLGHAALFGAGAYGAGVVAVHAGITEPLTLLLIGMAAGGVSGLVSGLVILRASGLPQLVLSIAVVQLAGALANKASTVTGGSDGLSGITPKPLFGTFEFDLYGQTGYVLGIALLIVVFGLLRLLVRSPFGLLCRGIREDEIRVRALGARIKPALVTMYGISGLVAGLGGALSAITTGVVGLDSVSFERSATALVMLVFGGSGSLSGAIIGTVVFQVFEHIVSAANPFHWLTIMGLLLIAVMLFLPGGLQKIVASVPGLWRRR